MSVKGLKQLKRHLRGEGYNVSYLDEAIEALENKQKYEELINNIICDYLNFDCNVCHAVYTCNEENREQCKLAKINEYKINNGLGDDKQ